jgi:two-component system sensor histidine kinase UhpB
MHTDMAQIQEMTRGSHDEIRRIARRLRPGDLETLGLVSALRSLADEFSTAGGVTVHCRLDTELPHLDHETELVIYRVAQEGLTNVARHAQAKNADIVLHRHADGIELRIRDDGRGIGSALAGTGLAGMRERALLIAADLAVGPGPHGGTEVQLNVPDRSK